MYTKYFGFNEKPFTLTPNPRFIYLSKNHKEAFAHLLYGINNHYGFIELIGEVGTGKTTVLRTLLSQLQEDKYRTALIVNPCLTGVELLRSISHEFGLNAKSEYANELLVEINNFLLTETSNGRTVVLVIDEAQNLQPAVLEQIRLISNLETESDKLIQIVLAGQPELGLLLEKPELRQLNQRIAVRYRLKSMSMLETRTYIRHRMEIAGETGGVSFSLFATRLIYLYTRGVPRMINILCDRSLLVAYGDERRRITAGIVTRSIKELLNVPQGNRLSRAFIGAIIIAAVSIVLSLSTGTFRLDSIFQRPAPPTATVNTPSVAAAKAVKTPDPVISGSPLTIADQQFMRLKQEVSSYDQKTFHMSAFNAIADEWGARRINIFNGQLTVPKMYSRLAAKRNLRVTEFKGSLDDVTRFDLPFLVRTKFSDAGEEYCVAVTSIRNDTLTISPSLLGSNTLSKADLSLISSGTFYLIWQNIGQIPEKITPGDKRYEIRVLQQLLQQAGMYTGSIDGIYSSDTATSINNFQRSAGISRDENVGALTLAALAKFNKKQKVPSISSAGSEK